MKSWTHNSFSKSFSFTDGWAVILNYSILEKYVKDMSVPIWWLLGQDPIVVLVLL